MPMEGKTVREAALAHELGLPRALLKRHREGLSKGDEWEMDGVHVAYTPAGVIKLRKLLGLKKTDFTRACQMSLPAQAVVYQPPDQTLVVEAITRNSRVLMARFEDSPLSPRGEKHRGENGLVRVSVQNNVNFVPGMPIECRHVQADLWELIGRCPRSRGRW